MEREIRYYTDELNDDFAGTNIKTIHLPENFKYHSKNPFKAIRAFFLYRFVVTPVLVVYLKLIRRVSYKNKKCMKGYKNRGCFLFGNHTAYACDAFNPTYLAFPRAAEVMVNEDATSIRGIRWLIMDLGALPIPDRLHSMPDFTAAVERAVNRGRWVAVYPEAHIWPYYTGVRNFSSVSFKYPVKLNAPSFAFTVTYKKRRFSDKPKITVYVDGPFFPDTALPRKQAAQKLRNEVYSAMKARADEYSTYVYKYSYVCKSEATESEDGRAQR